VVSRGRGDGVMVGGDETFQEVGLVSLKLMLQRPVFALQRSAEERRGRESSPDSQQGDRGRLFLCEIQQPGDCCFHSRSV
jgi:hypothetical protein